MIPFPNISPVLFTIGSFELRWYSLAYIVGAILAIIYIKYLTKNISIVTKKQSKQFFDDLVFYILIGIILGGRIGYVLFYNFGYYIHNPLKIFYLWEGGMSFHGALIGSLIFANILAKKYKKSFLQITDILAPAVPIGLFLGRIANFINAELYGKPTSMPWGFIFPRQYIARHPSQLYEAFFEGIVLFVILLILWKKKSYYNPGKITGYAFIVYALSRIFVEFFRETEIYVLNIISMGQLLSFPMFLIGIYLIKKSRISGVIHAEK